MGIAYGNTVGIAKGNHSRRPHV